MKADCVDDSDQCSSSSYDLLDVSGKCLHCLREKSFIIAARYILKYNCLILITVGRK